MCSGAPWVIFLKVMLNLLLCVSGYFHVILEHEKKPSTYQAAAVLGIVEQVYWKGKKVLIQHFLGKFLVFYYEQKTSKMLLHQDPASSWATDSYLMEAAANISGVFQICHQFMREYSKKQLLPSQNSFPTIPFHLFSWFRISNQDQCAEVICSATLSHSALCDGVGLWVEAVVSNGTLRNVSLLLHASLSYWMQRQRGELGILGSSVSSTVVALLRWWRASYKGFGRLTCTLTLPPWPSIFYGGAVTFANQPRSWSPWWSVCGWFQQFSSLPVGLFIPDILSPWHQPYSVSSKNGLLHRCLWYLYFWKNNWKSPGHLLSPPPVPSHLA